MTDWTTLTGAGALVVDDGRVLMVRQRRPYGVHWELPSGYHEPPETLEEATAREVLEETAVAVDVGELVCTMLWERRHDRRRNLLAYFLATPRDHPVPEPRGQQDEGIEDAAFVDPKAMPAREIHPLHGAILDRWWDARVSRFHLRVDVVVRADDTQDYVFG